MPRYEQLKAKSKGISYTRQIRNDSKEINLKKPLIISVSFIILVAVIFSVVKKYSPMVDIAIKDFFSINHSQALVLETDGVSENSDKMSFLNNIPLFNFFIKENTNETLSVMTYETNSKIEAGLDTFADIDNFTNSSIITKESLLPFFNNSGSNNSILYDSGYVDYGDNHASVLFSGSNYNMNDNNNQVLEENTDDDIVIINNNQDINNNTESSYEESTVNTGSTENIDNTEQSAETDKPYNYLQQMILENRNNNNSQTLNERVPVNNNNNNNNKVSTNTKKANTSQNNNKVSQSTNNKSMFADILKPKENTAKRETTTMKPASSTTYGTKTPSNYTPTTEKTTNEKYTFNVDEYLKNNNVNKKDNEVNTIKREENNNEKKTDNNSQLSRKEIIQSSVYTINNDSLDKANIDYNRVINDMVNPNNNNSVIKRDDDIVKEDDTKIINDNNSIDNNLNNNNNLNNSNIIKENTSSEKTYKEELMKKAQNDINNYRRKKANNTITRASTQRELKRNNDEGIYLVEYSENTGSITLIFRERKFNNKSSVEEAIKELLIGATDEENSRNIISCIPKDTELLDIFVEGDTVYLNFNESFEFNPLGNEGTMVQIYQFVYTATQFKGIDNVIFLINGQLNETIGAEGAIENMPFRRFEK